MGNMKNTMNRMMKQGMKAAKQYRDFEDLLRAGKQEYQNTAVQAVNAETHALRFALNEMWEMIHEQQKTIAEQQMQINRLEGMLMKGMRTGSVSITETTTRTVDVGYEQPLFLEEIERTYRKGVNINWNCGMPPVDIAFNEFDMYRKRQDIYGMITPEDVRIISSTLYQQCKKLTGLTVSRLLKEYARSRQLNY